MQQATFLDEAPVEIFSDEWYTPASVVEPARAVLGSIDLDPASCATAQWVVKASHYYTKADNGLTQPWYGNVFLNPPYSMPLIVDFVDKVLAEYTAGNITAAIILTNNATDTTWAQKLLAYPVCFHRGRVRFWQPGKPGNSGARQGQIITYLGQAVQAFSTTFSALGTVR
jgi:ParB family chromosome partitioning protein